MKDGTHVMMQDLTTTTHGGSDDQKAPTSSACQSCFVLNDETIEELAL